MQVPAKKYLHTLLEVVDLYDLWLLVSLCIDAVSLFWYLALSCLYFSRSSSNCSGVSDMWVNLQSGLLQPSPPGLAKFKQGYLSLLGCGPVIVDVDEGAVNGGSCWLLRVVVC